MGDSSEKREFDKPPKETSAPRVRGIPIFISADDCKSHGIRHPSWTLPKGWHIVLTANPDGGDYSVTPMDDAMLTRMLHIGLDFDVKAWARWAEQSGVDSRGINFVLTYPETVSGVRTTPRTLVQFFSAIASIKDLESELPMATIAAS